MKLNELLNTCQNAWTNVVSHNKKFKANIYGNNGKIITLDANYQNNNDYYKINNLKVAFWEMSDYNTLNIELEY